MSDAAFEEDGPRGRAGGADDLVVDLDGYEGPIDVLLTLAREQKVDLTKHLDPARSPTSISPSSRAARQLRLEIAADYLVMAAWLAYLKSRLLLPDAARADDEPSGEELAAALAHQLQLLEAMQRAGARADGAAAARPRRVRARRAGGPRRVDRAGLRAEPLRSAEGLWRQPSPAARPGPDDHAGRPSLDGRRAGAAGAAARPGAGMAQAG